MSAKNKQTELSDYAAETIRHKARQLVGKAGFTKDDLDDVRQDLTLDLLERLPKFNPDKAVHSTFVARVIERKISKLIRHRMQEKRDYRRNECSVNDWVTDTNGRRVERAQTLSRDEHDLRMGRHTRPETERIDLEIDTRIVISQLPPDLKPIAERLFATCSITEVAQEFGIPRGTFYETALARLRAIFENKDLEDYI